MLSKRDGDGWFPNDRVIRSLFPTVFGADLPAELRLPAKLRGYIYIKGEASIQALVPSRPEEESAERIHMAVSTQAERLARLVDILPLLEKRTTASVLRASDRREALLRLAWSETAQHASLDEEAAEALIVATAAANAEVRTMTAVRRLLAEESLVAELAERRDRAVLRERPRTLDDALARSVGPLLEFLDDEVLATKHRVTRGGTVTLDELVGPGTPAAAKWAAVRSVDNTLWQFRASALGLSSTSPPGPAPIRVVDEPADIRVGGPAVAWLDTSIERRLGSVLRGERDVRRGLPCERELLTLEVDRASRPLGVENDAARAVLALGATVAPMIGERAKNTETIVGVEVPDTRVAAAIRSCFHQWMKKRQGDNRTATTPYVGTAVVEPTEYYISALWTRVHGHDVHGSADYDATTAHDLLTGAALTVTDRLDAAGRVRVVTTEDAGDLPGAEDTGTDAEIDFILVTEAIDRVRKAVDDPQVWADFWYDLQDADEPTESITAQWRAWTALADVSLDIELLHRWMRGHDPE